MQTAFCRFDLKLLTIGIFLHILMILEPHLTNCQPFMRRTLFLFITVFSLFLSSNISAQRINVGSNHVRVGAIKVKFQSQAAEKLISGDALLLLRIKKLDIRNTRDSMKVCEYGPEAAYLEQRCKDRDEAAAKAIRDKWTYMHEAVCEPGFAEYFNKYAAKEGITGINYSSEKLPVLLVKLKMEEPHYHPAGWNTPPSVTTMECLFLDTLGNELAVFQGSVIGNVKGNNQDRLKDCYSIAGKMRSRELVKRLRKF